VRAGSVGKGTSGAGFATCGRGVGQRARLELFHVGVERERRLPPQVFLYALLILVLIYVLEGAAGQWLAASRLLRREAKVSWL